MKKIAIFVVSVLALLAVSCGPRASKAEVTDVDSTEVAAADSLVAADTVAVDSAAVEK